MRRQSLNKLMLSVFRARMVWLWMTGMSAREISCFTGASVSTVYRWVRRWQAGGSVEAKHCRGRQPEGMLNEYFPLETREHLQGLAAAVASCEVYEHRSCQAVVPCVPLTGDCLLPCTCNTASFEPLISKQMQLDFALKFHRAFFPFN